LGSSIRWANVFIANLMKKLNLKLHRRSSKMVSIRVPEDTLAQLKSVAAQKELGYQALLKLYIGDGLRRDLAAMSQASFIAKTVNVLRKHIADEKKVAVIERSLKKLVQ
jgi:ATP phosphoribosyltransferase